MRKQIKQENLEYYNINHKNILEKFIDINKKMQFNNNT